MITLPRIKAPVSVPSRRTLPCVRPSLLDLRFTGDPSLIDEHDGTASVRLADYPLTTLSLVPFDLPSLNRLLLQLRLGQCRRQGLGCCARRGR